jgi:hypothetical protein
MYEKKGRCFLPFGSKEEFSVSSTTKQMDAIKGNITSYFHIFTDYYTSLIEFNIFTKTKLLKHLFRTTPQIAASSSSLSSS